MPNQILENIKQILLAISKLLPQLFPPPAYDQDPKTLPMNEEPIKPTAPKNNVLNSLALAVQHHEGWFDGSRSKRNRNPGNTRFSRVGYLPIYEPVGQDWNGVKQGQQPFAVFKDYETGFLYLKNLILQKARRHPDWTLYQFIGDEKEGWAPASDNNNVNTYVASIATRTGLNPATFRLRDLL